MTVRLLSPGCRTQDFFFSGLSFADDSSVLMRPYVSDLCYFLDIVRLHQLQLEHLASYRHGLVRQFLLFVMLLKCFGSIRWFICTQSFYTPAYSNNRTRAQRVLDNENLCRSFRRWFTPSCKHFLFTSIKVEERALCGASILLDRVPENRPITVPLWEVKRSISSARSRTAFLFTWNGTLLPGLWSFDDRREMLVIHARCTQP